MTEGLTRLLDEAALDADSIALSVDHMIRSGRRRRRGRTLLTGVTGLATVALIAAGFLLMRGGAHNASQAGGNDPASGRGADISFTASGALMAVFHDPYATAATLRAVFKQRGLQIRVELETASPSLVGKAVGGGRGPGVGAGAIALFGFQNDCATAPHCPAGITVSADWTGQGSVAIGVPAGPGANYGTANDSTAYGEALYCSNILGSTVAQAQVILAAHHLTVDTWRGVGGGNFDPRLSPDLVVDNVLPNRLGHVFLGAETRAEFEAYPAKNQPCYPTALARAG